jgi:RNA polymerase sigma-70 factor (ECF subfamily)
MSDKTDNRDFFQQAASMLMDRLYGAALNLTRNHEDAEELVALTLECGWKALNSLQDRQCFDGWMLRILSNQFVSKWRKQKIQEKYFDQEGFDELDETNCLYARLHQPFLLWWSSPENQFVNNLLRDDIDRAIADIPEVYREVVVMVEMLEHSYQEVSEMLDIPVGTVRSRLNRGRRLLQDALWENARDAGIKVKPSQGAQK